MFNNVFRKFLQSYLDYTIHVYSLLILLLNCEERRPRFLDTFLRQNIAAWNVATLHQLRLKGVQVLASFFSKQHIYDRLTAKRRIRHSVSSVPT